MRKLRFAFFGAGYWAGFQLPAWQELSSVECVALYNRTHSAGEKLAHRFGVPAVYDDPEELLNDAELRLDFVDLCTNPFTLPGFVKLVAAHRLAVISQKPMAPSVAIAEDLVATCHEAGVPYFVHENWRWETLIRALKDVLGSGEIGEPFRARLTMVSGFDVFANEPTLTELEDFILTDMGTHILDVVRFLFGEPRRLYCQIQRVSPAIRGEDVATVMLSMGNEATVTCEMGYPGSFYEQDVFPQTLMFVEGSKGTAEIAADYWLKVTTSDGTRAQRCPPRAYSWAEPDHAVVEESIVRCHENIVGALLGHAPAETTGEDNLKTIKLVHAAYDSARNQKVVSFEDV